MNLKANWTLLERTGTSTNVFSKAAYDLARLRPASVRTQRFASRRRLSGHGACERGALLRRAFGAVFLSDSVSSADALIFLAGTNLGAAAYEYGLGRVTRAFLKSR